jgi:hypothetical protein
MEGTAAEHNFEKGPCKDSPGSSFGANIATQML